MKQSKLNYCELDKECIKEMEEYNKDLEYCISCGNYVKNCIFLGQQPTTEVYVYNIDIYICKECLHKIKFKYKK